MKIKLLFQTGIVFGICWLGEAASALLPIPIPGSVMGMLLLFLLLLILRKTDPIEEITEFLLKNMAFFFIPAGVGILAQFDLLWEKLLPLLTICVLTTLLTFLATAYTVRGVQILQEKARRRKEAR